LKYVDTEETITHIFSPVSATITCLNCLDVQGDTSITRNADQISPTSLRFRLTYFGDIQWPAPTVIRHVILWDRGPAGLLPTIGEIFDLNTSTLGINHPYNRQQSDRFKILYDKVTIIKTLAQANTSNNYFVEDKFVYKKIRLGRQVKYSGNTGTISDLVSNALISVMFSDVAAANAHAAGCIALYRMYYKDA